MAEPSCILVYGLDELASAVARTLLLAGHAVAMHQSSSPTMLRRKMSFCDAWYDGAAALDGVEARRADNDADFLVGLRTRMYIPLLTRPLLDTIERWPWDITVDARRIVDPGERQIRSNAELTIVLGPGAVAGADCDLVIETTGPDPGAVLRTGSAKSEPREMESYEIPVAASAHGIFQTRRAIGEVVAKGDLIGIIDAIPVAAPRSGRLRGLQRSPRSVRSGEVVAEIANGTSAPVSGIHRADRIIARAVEFAIELEQKTTPTSFVNLKWRF